MAFHSRAAGPGFFLHRSVKSSGTTTPCRPGALQESVQENNACGRVARVVFQMSPFRVTTRKGDIWKTTRPRDVDTRDMGSGRIKGAKEGLQSPLRKPVNWRTTFIYIDLHLSTHLDTGIYGATLSGWLIWTPESTVPHYPDGSSGHRNLRCRTIRMAHLDTGICGATLSGWLIWTPESAAPHYPDGSSGTTTDRISKSIDN